MKSKALFGICSLITISAVLWSLSRPESPVDERKLVQEAPAPKLVSQFNNKNIIVIGTWAHQASRLRLVKKGVDFYLEIKTPTAITAESVTTKNEFQFFNPNNHDSWLIDTNNFIQTRLKNENLSREDKRLIIWEKTKEW